MRSWGQETDRMWGSPMGPVPPWDIALYNLFDYAGAEVAFPQHVHAPTCKVLILLITLFASRCRWASSAHAGGRDTPAMVCRQAAV